MESSMFFLGTLCFFLVLASAVSTDSFHLQEDTRGVDESGVAGFKDNRAILHCTVQTCCSNAYRCCVARKFCCLGSLALMKAWKCPIIRN